MKAPQAAFTPSTMSNRILIVAEHDGAHLNPSTAKCVTCAAAIPDS